MLRRTDKVYMVFDQWGAAPASFGDSPEVARPRYVAHCHNGALLRDAKGDYAAAWQAGYRDLRARVVCLSVADLDCDGKGGK